MTLTEKADYAKGILSGAQIKRIAVESMVIDHAGGYTELCGYVHCGMAAVF